METRTALCALIGAIMTLWTPHAAAQLCDDRYAGACPLFGGAPGPPPQPGYGAQPWQQPGYGAQPWQQPQPGYGAQPWQQSQPGAYGPRVIVPQEEEPVAPLRRPGADFVQPLDPGISSRYGATYARLSGEAFPVPAVDVGQIGSQFLRRTVSYPTGEPAGTIVIDPQNHFLYLVQGGGQAIRYGVGVGRQGFAWSGTAHVHEKREWPDWYPPKEMVQRQPELRRVLGELQSGLGMPGGPRNPLGARALYLWQGNKDTLFRIHGTVEPWTIGSSVSSGCIRMINQDVIDLYQRTPIGAKVVVLRS